MRINKFMAVMCLLLPLCGCGLYNYSEQTDYTRYYNEEKSKQIEYIEASFNTAFEKLSAEQKKIIQEDFTPVNNVRYIQHSNGRDVMAYESKKLKGAYVLYDGEWLSYILPDGEELKNCTELYKKLEGTAFAPSGVVVGDNGAGAIKCANKEFILMDFGNVTPFSVLYNDVDVKTENMPVCTVVYANNGKVDRVEFISIASPDISNYSKQNTDDAVALLETLGLGNESADIANELAQSLNKGSYSRRDGALSIRSSKAVKRSEELVFNVFTITMK